MRRQGGGGMRMETQGAGMMMEAYDETASELSPSIMMKSSRREFAIPSEPKVILRSLFPETWLFDLVHFADVSSV